MLGEPENQFSLTRTAYKTRGAKEGTFYQSECARELAGQVVAAKKARHTATAAEVSAQQTLMTSLRDIQERGVGAKFSFLPRQQVQMMGLCISQGLNLLDAGIV